MKYDPFRVHFSKDTQIHINAGCCKIYTCPKCGGKVAGHIAWYHAGKQWDYDCLPEKVKKERGNVC